MNIIDRRREPRMPFITGVRFVAWGSSDVITGRLGDLSEHGCFVSLLAPRNLDEKLWVTIAYGGVRVGAVGRVAHVAEEGIGVTFSKIQMPDQYRLILWLESMRAATAKPKQIHLP